MRSGRTVWIGDEAAVVVNMPDRAYDYERPDHWRLPPDAPQIPFTLQGVGRPGLVT